MLIANIYGPSPSQGGSAEENIMSNNLKELYDEIRQMVFDTRLIISPLKTKKGSGSKKGTTGAVKLAESLNNAFKGALESIGWKPLHAPGAPAPQSLIDWYKAKPSGRRYGATELGLGLEIQFGNNYQFNEDIKRLSEAYLAGYIVAGVSIVPSDSLAQHKADRGASFSDAKSKLDRHLETLAIAQAKRFPPIEIIGVQQDGYNDDPYGYFEIAPISFRRDARGILESKAAPVISNGKDSTIIKRRKMKAVVGGEGDEE